MLAAMCANCAMGAMAAAAGATGMRTWLRTRLGPRALKAASAGLVTSALIVASVAVPV